MKKLVLIASGDPELYTFSWEQDKGTDTNLTKKPQVKNFIRIIDKKGRTIEITNFPIIIGRYHDSKDDANIMINDDLYGYVSRKHALITEENNAIKITDMKSRWGTRIYRKGGQKIPVTTTPEQLEDEDRIELAAANPKKNPPVQLLVKFEEPKQGLLSTIKSWFR